MKIPCTLICCIFLFVLPVFAQNTTVSGTITDTPDGQAWFGGTFSFVFRVSPSNPTAQYFFNGAPFSSSQTIAGALDGSGHYSQGVPPNTSITPAGSTWDVTFCPLATAQCVTYQSVTVTGATQTFAPSPPSIRINLAVPLQNPRAYTDAEVVNGALGQSYFNLIISTIKLCNFFPCGWAVISGGGGNPANPVGSVQVNVAGSFGPGPQVSTVAINPQTNDNICYVSPNGNDSNDGLSIGAGHSKLTVYSCLTTVLPGGDSTHAGNGTVLISGQVSYGGPVANQGFWLMGGTDPNFGSPPSGWLKVNATFAPAITLDCFAGYVAAGTQAGHCTLLGGARGSPSLPPVWISGVSGNISIQNISFSNFLGNYIRYGIDSNNNRSGTGGGSSGFSLTNVAFNSGGCGLANASGPGVDIGGTSFWIWMKRNVFTGCPPKIFTVANSGAVRSSGVTTITTTATNDVSTGELLTITNVTDDSFNGSFVVTQIDTTHFTYSNPGPNATSGTGQVVTARTAAINIDPGTGPGDGLIFIDDTNLNGGNIRYVNGTNGGGFYVNNLSYEGGGSGSGIPDAPIVLITGTKATSNADGTKIRVDNVEISDPNNASLVPGVQVDNPTGGFPDLVKVSRIAGFVRGKMSVDCCTDVAGSVSGNLNTATYLRQQQYGMRQGQVTATGIDVARRGFSPVVVKGTNLAVTNPTGWTFGTGTGTITTGIAAPDGTNNAGRVTFSSGVPSATVQFYSSTTALNLGDYYLFGFWVRSSTNNGYAGNVPPILFNFNGGGLGVGDLCLGPQGAIPSGAASVILGNAAGSNQSDGQWQWYTGICKVIGNATTPGTFFGAAVDSTHSADFYAPMLVLLPASTISDNEAYEIALNLSSWPSSAATGEISMLPNQRLHHGTTTFANLGTPNNASDIYCTDCVVNSNPCVGTGTGAFAQGINGAWVCGGGGGGGGCAPGGITDALQYNGGGTCSFGGVNSPTVNGNYVVNYNVTASAAVPPTINLPGVPINPQTGTTYIEGSANTQSDRFFLITANNAGAQTYTPGNPSATGFGFNYGNALDVIGAGAVTETASGFSINGVSNASFVTPASWLRWWWTDGANARAEAVPTARAFPACLDTGGNHYNKDANGNLICGTSASGNGLSGMTAGQVPIAASATSVTSSEALAGAGAAITTGPATSTSLDVVEFTGTGGQIADTGVLFSNVWRKDAANISLSVNHDFSAGTWKIPAGAGFTAGATSNFGLDTTAKLFHCYLNNADVICSALSTISPATTSNTIGNANNPQTWNWLQTTATQAAMTWGEAVASPSTGGTLTGSLANQTIGSFLTQSGSTATPLNVTQGSVTGATAFPAMQIQSTWNGTAVNKGLIVAITNTATGGGSHILDLLAGSGGTTNEFNVDSAGNTTVNGIILVGGGLVEGSAAANTVTYQGGKDNGASTVGPGVFRGADNNTTTAAAAAGAATLRGGDEIGSTGNQLVGGNVFVRGGNVTLSTTSASTGGNVSITGGQCASVASANTCNGVIKIVQPYFSSGTATANDLACVTAANTIASCTATGTGQFVGVIDSSSTNVVNVVSLGGGGTHIFNATSATFTNGHFVCQSTVASAGNLVVDSSTACATGLGVGIYIGATGTQTAPLVWMKPN